MNRFCLRRERDESRFRVLRATQPSPPVLLSLLNGKKGRGFQFALANVPAHAAERGGRGQPNKVVAILNCLVLSFLCTCHEVSSKSEFPQMGGQGKAGGGLAHGSRPQTGDG